ncbi:serine hydrolase [Aquimarina sp. AU474]|uniref:serine hydrolase n=1 Tax=Aquimarina sp. AU474 TaxID=2108529 RepID=UPI000D688CA4|nr:serine hydrolase [Aquimarina sp. AU474]
MKTLKIMLLIFIFTFGNYDFEVNAQSSNKEQPLGFEALKEEIRKQMKSHNLHGLSVAVFEDYKVIWTNEWGIKAANSDEKIESETAFSTASTSKAIVSILCGILEEKGLIDLNSPINTYLQRWKLPKSDLVDANTLNWLHFLSHTAGTTQSGFADFYEGDKIPTIVQSLKGELLPRYNREIEFIFTPGTDWEYSGGGYVIIQMALEDHFKKPLADLIKEHVFDPLGLKNTTMKQPNESGFLKNVAKVHNAKGEIIKTGLPITPQVAPSGMWSTPYDLSLIAIEMQNALRNKNNTLISNKVAKKITDVVSLKKAGGWSAGWHRSYGIANRDWFAHGGSNTGVGGEYMATMKGGNGIAILANGDKPNRIPVMNFLRNEIIHLRGWEARIDPSLIKRTSKTFVSAIQGAYLDFLYGAPGINKIYEENGKLFMSSQSFKHLVGRKNCEMFYVGKNTFRIDQYPNYVKFDLDANNELKEIIIYRDKSMKNAIIIKKEEVRNHKTALVNAFSQYDMNIAIKEYRKIKEEAPSLNFEQIFNEFGYMFYIENDINKAIKILEFNSKEHPTSFNTYDSLGEIYELSGAIKKSIENYKKAGVLNKSGEYKDRVKQKILDLEKMVK